MTTTQSISADRYRQARRDERRYAKTEPDSLAHAAAECAADLARESYWTERAMARSAKP